MKKHGNDAFQKKLYSDAVSHYSRALESSGKNVRGLLNNWAQCALELESLNDVISTSSAAV